MISVVNKREGKCAECACPLLSGEGRAVLEEPAVYTKKSRTRSPFDPGKRWRLYCSDHLPQEAPCSFCGAARDWPGLGHDTNCPNWRGR